MSAFSYISFFNLYNSPIGRHYNYPHFTDEETVAQRGKWHCVKGRAGEPTQGVWLLSEPCVGLGVAGREEGPDGARGGGLRAAEGACNP